ncbi:hypothetical protein GCM10009827_047310 [Dactylosporangium maewongense]|uniref:Uncharacterized protein n=1 Tax=Dactylosporangium maewongense TaxID=634393 RepID=A0ABP4LLG5_9ACTN
MRWPVAHGTTAAGSACDHNHIARELAMVFAFESVVVLVAGVAGVAAAGFVAAGFAAAGFAAAGFAAAGFVAAGFVAVGLFVAADAAVGARVSPTVSAAATAHNFRAMPDLRARRCA